MDNPTDAPARPEGAPSFKVLDQEWCERMAELCLEGLSKESVLSIWVEAGYDPSMFRPTMERMERDPIFKAARRLQQRHFKLESVVSNLQRLWEVSPGYGTVEKRTMPSREEFIERYVVGCRPVVLTDLTQDWPAMRRWSPDDMKSRFGHVEVEIQDERDTNPKYEQTRWLHTQRVQMAEFVDRVVSGGPTNNYYLTANNGLVRQPEFQTLYDDIGTLPPICKPELLRRLSNLWFGPAGTISPIHHDTMMLFHAQVVGRKRWRLISPLETPRMYNHTRVYSEIDVDAPDLNRFPKFGQIGKVLDVVVEPGETLFLPLAWWHEVTALDVSISFAFWNLDVPLVYHYADPGVHNA
jgi:hypothetical protein